MTEIISNIDSMRQEIIDYRRSFHKYPEVGWTEFRTASIVARTLEELGFDVKLGKDVVKETSRMGLPPDEYMDACYDRAILQGADPDMAGLMKGGYTGVVGKLVCGDGPVIALRFDMDALPVTESGDDDHVPQAAGFASENKGIMHACAHDGHTAMGLGVASVISSMRHTFNGTYKLIFQPAEEGVRGAKAMTEAGVLEDVDYVLGAHLGMGENRGGMLYPGVSGFYATSKFDIHLKGVPSHAGAAPEAGKNALLAGAAMALQLHSIPRHSGGVTRVNVGRLEAGTGRNIIPDEALLIVETRGATSALNEYMVGELRRIVQSVSQLYDVAFEITEVGRALGAESDADLAELAAETAEELGSFREVEPICDDFGGCEDFTEMMQAVQDSGGKSSYMIVGSNIKAPHHNGRFDFDEEDMINGVKLLSMMALKLGRR